ncbi:DUF397 domain-containing protein [Streptomyces sp. NPDC055749]
MSLSTAPAPVRGSAPGTVHVRDSKHLPGPQLGFAPTAWAAFVSYASTN